MSARYGIATLQAMAVDALRAQACNDARFISLLVGLQLRTRLTEAQIINLIHVLAAGRRCR